MTLNRTIKTSLPFLVLAGIMAAQVWLGLGPIETFSATYDESVHITAGVSYWQTGQYAYNGYHHPAFGEMWMAFPVVLSGAQLPLLHPAWLQGEWNPQNQYRFADAFLYKGKVSFEKILALARSAQLLLSVLFTLSLFLLALSKVGWISGLALGGLWAFSPSALAHGTLGNTDLAFAIFFFLFFLTFQWVSSKKWGLVSGIFLGLCLGSKYTALSIGPILAAIFFVLFLFSGGLKNPKKGWRVLMERFPPGSLLILGGAAFLMLFLIYRGDLSVFWGGMAEIIGRSQAGRSSFFMGEHAASGWFAYFPVAVLFKTPLIILMGLLVALVIWGRGEKKVNWILLLPPLLFFILACFSRVQIGHRHILCVYPFLFYFIAVQVPQMRFPKGVLAALLLTLLATSAAARPDFLSFFNRAVGGGKAGYRFFTDSNVDWGQGLKSLANGLKKQGIEEPIFLSYFGTADPSAYGIAYISVGSDGLVSRRDSRHDLEKWPDYFAISVTNLQATYYANRDVFSWLKERDPIATYHDAIFLYDLKEDADKKAFLAQIAGL